MNPVTSTSLSNAPVAQNAPLLNLPDELITHILSYLSASDVLAASLTCRHLQTITQDNSIWKSLLNNKFKD